METEITLKRMENSLNKLCQRCNANITSAYRTKGNCENPTNEERKHKKKQKHRKKKISSQNKNHKEMLNVRKQSKASVRYNVEKKKNFAFDLVSIQ